MFMFWGKRTSYTKRLLKAKVRGEHETECEAQENLNHIASVPNLNTNVNASLKQQSEQNTGLKSSSQFLSGFNNKSCGGSASASGAGGAGATVAEDNNYKRTLNADFNRVARCKELLKSLKENQLEMLLAAVESYGANLGACVMVKRRRGNKCDAPATNEIDNHDYYDFEKKLKTDTETRESFQEEFNTSSFTTLSNASNHQRNNNHHHHHHLNNHNRRTQRQENNKKLKERAAAAAAAVAVAAAATCNEDGICDETICLEDRMNNRICSTATTTTTTTANSRRSTRSSGSNNCGASNNELPVDPHLLCCQIWRWPDLNNSSELKRLPVCHSADDPVDICCNPYHWSRLCKPESPPPPYCLIADRLRPEDRAPSEGGDAALHRRCRNTNSPPLPGSLTTNGEDSSGQREWCTLAYWELGGRVGRLYPVEPSTVNVFDSLLDGDGLCLASLAENHSTSPSIQRTRSKIGLGLTLSQESDGVWAYNRSDNPIFVNSPTLDDPESRTLLVYRVPPGFCLNIFDRAKTSQCSSYMPTSVSTLSLSPASSPSSCPGGGVGTEGPAGGGGGAAASFTSGPVDVNSVRISFAKGWGPKYSRQEVTSCPCWLEVLLAPCR